MLSNARNTPVIRQLALLTATLLGCAGAPAFAQTVNGNSHNIEAHISVIGLINLDVDAVANTTMPPSVLGWTSTDAIPDLDVGNAIASVSAGVLQADLEFEPSASNFVAGSSSTAAGVAVSAVALLGSPLLAISANQITTTTLVSGYCPQGGAKRSAPRPNDLGDEINNLLFSNGFDSQTLVPQIATETPGLAISILGIDIPALPNNAAPNTAIDLQVLGIAGATLVLNEQNSGGDGINTLATSANAVHLTLNVAGLITADVVLGHSDLTVDCSN